MKVIEISSKFGIEFLTISERPEPVAGPGQILVKMKAFSLNFRDLLVVNAVNQWKPSLPRIPLSDGVGVVVGLGSNISRVKLGDRVAPIFYPKWLEGRVTPAKVSVSLGGASTDGVLAEYCLFDESSIVHVPEYLTDEEAATLPCAAVTAWNALVICGQIKSGDIVVVLGTGGVSLFTLQLAHSLDARVIVTSSSDQKLLRAKQLGASDTINYKITMDWPKAVMELTDGLGADYVIDTVGDLNSALAGVKFGGKVVFVGLLNGMKAEIDLVKFMGKSARIEAIDVGSREMFEAMNKAIEFHQLHPVIDRVFKFSEASAAFKYLAEAKHFGKVCLRV